MSYCGLVGCFQYAPCSVHSRLQREDLLSAFAALTTEAKELYLSPTIPRIEVPSPLVFLRDYVARNKPVILTGAVDHWRALTLWSNAYLTRVLKDTEVTVDLTPDGHGDTVRDGVFVTPVEKKMLFPDFISQLNNSSGGVPYCQHQNSSLSEEMSPLLADIEELDWASEVFGSPPDAINFWMGNEKAVSSLHHDPYENLYVVVAGEKHFTLFPPTDLPWLGQEEFKKAHYEEISGDKPGFRVVLDEPACSVPWFPIDPDGPVQPVSSTWNPQMASALRIVVRKGELLYLPALWFHRVSQKPDEEGRAIAVNYWYDMAYDFKWAYYKFVEKVCGCLNHDSGS